MREQARAASIGLCVLAMGVVAAVATSGPLLLPSHAAWSPPLGWGTWLVVGARGALLLASVSMSRPSASSRA